MRKIYLFIFLLCITTLSTFAQPIVSAPTPSQAPADVISVYCDIAAYSSLPGTNFNPDWMQQGFGNASEISISGDNIRKYANFNYQGWQFASAINASSMTHLHVDVWTPDCTGLQVFPIVPGQPEQSVTITTTLNGWTSFDIPLSSYTIPLSNIIQFKFVGNPFSGSTIYLDNVYFWKPANTPTLSNFTIPTQVTTNPPFTITAPTSNSTGAFTYISANPNVATIAGNTVTITGAGTSLITANQAAAGAYGAGSVSATLTVTAPPLTTAAPTPTVAAANVISLFSNAYTNVPVNTWSAGWDQADVADVQIAGNDTKLYTNLNFAGVEFTGSNLIDATNMQYYHVDVWTPNATVFRVKLRDFGANEVFDLNGDDVEHEYTLPTFTQSGWNTYDIPLTAFTGLTNRAHLAQMLFVSSAGATLYIDNVYFYTAAVLPTAPVAAAPTPNIDSANVISLFSNTYTNVNIDTWRTGWSQATLTDLQIAGNDTKLYNNLAYVGVEFTGANLIDATNKEFLHIDVWTPNATAFRVKLVDFGPNAVFSNGGDDSEFEITVPALTQGIWKSYNIPMSSFTGLASRAHLAQLIFSAVQAGAAKVYIDNVYFYTIPALPMIAAPTPPTRTATDVISLFSGAYSDIMGTDFFPNWMQLTVVTDLMIAGNPTKKYATLNYQGVQLASALDLTTFEYLHVDIWTPNCTSFKISLINTTQGAEQAFTMVPVIAGWNSINVPLTAFSSFVAAVNLNAISQLKIEGAPSGTSTVFLDNLYFYKGLPLPIKLSSFEVTKENKTAILNWNTSLENNNRGFNVLRSANGTKWETLTFVNGLGYSSTDHAYTFTDVNPIAGVNYYKLKQEDFDGKFNYSEIRAVRFGDKATFNFTLFPNPTSQRVFIDVSNLKQANATVNIVNAAGVVVLSKYVSVLNGYFNLSLDVSKLAKGNYFIQIQNSDNKNISKALIIE